MVHNNATMAAAEAKWAKDRRERIATAVLAGIAGRGQFSELTQEHAAARRALEFADALIAALDAPNEGVPSGT